MLPDFEALAIFAVVVEKRSFSGAATELKLSKATVSKAVGRLEEKLGTRLLNRTSRRFSLTEAGLLLTGPAQRVLAEAQQAESEARAQSSQPRGIVRLAAPMSFGLLEVAPILPVLMQRHSQLSVELHLDDQLIDLIGGGFDLALRIAALADSSLIARRLCAVPRHLVAAPAYLEKHGAPVQPADLARHACLGYAYQRSPGTWSFLDEAGERASVRVSGPLQANNADALTPSLLAGLGVAVQPEFMIRDALADGRLVKLLPSWSPPPIALHLVMPPGGPRPRRVEAVIAFLVEYLARRDVE